MSLLFRTSTPAGEQRYTLNQLAALSARSRASYEILGTVDADTAMRHDAVWACRTRIAQDVSMMPVDVVRYSNGARIEVNPTPQIIAAPSATVDAMDWRYQLIDSWLANGNAWGIVTQTTPDTRYPLRIELIPHSSVVGAMEGNELALYVDGKRHDLWPVGDLWHKPCYTVAGQFLGLSPIAHHAMSIGNGLAAEKFSADFFNDGGHPTAILGVEGDPTEEQARGLKERLMSLTRGNREPLVIPKAHTYTQLQINPSDSQFIDVMRYSVEQVCRIYGEDPADYGSSAGGSLTYANRSDADLARFKRRQYWVTKLQNVLTDMLPRPQVVKLNTSSSLMMTAKERHEIHAIRLQSKTATINEVRKIEDERPFDGAEFDEPGVPIDSDTPDVVEVAPMQENAALMIAEMRAAMAEQSTRTSDTHIHLPENLQVEMRNEPIIIPAPIVNVPAAEVTVNVEPTPVVVNVAAPVVEVAAPVVNVAAANVPAPQVTVVSEPARRHKVRRDSAGNIIEIVQEG
jgi:HK97 family phage portal protein